MHARYFAHKSGATIAGSCTSTVNRCVRELHYNTPPNYCTAKTQKDHIFRVRARTSLLSRKRVEFEYFQFAENSKRYYYVRRIYRVTQYARGPCAHNVQYEHVTARVGIENVNKILRYVSRTIMKIVYTSVRDFHELL